MKLSLPQMAQLLMQVGDVIPFRRRPQRGEVPGIPEVGPMGGSVVSHPRVFDASRFRNIKRVDPDVGKRLDQINRITNHLIENKGMTADAAKYEAARLMQAGIDPFAP